MNRNNLFTVLATISCLGIIFLLCVDFFGETILWLSTFTKIIGFIIVIYIISFLETLISLLRIQYFNNKIKISIHVVTLFLVILAVIAQSELFKSKRILTATMKDDSFQYELILRENNNCEISTLAFLGSEEVNHGKYLLSGDTIIFTKIPQGCSFMSDRLLIDRNQEAIFTKQDKSGNFSKSKSYLNYFAIEKDSQQSTEANTSLF